MARKKKNTVENDNQIKMFDNKNLKDIDISENSMVKNVNKGELLEYQIKRLFFFMGYFPKTNIIIQTSSDEPYDTVTD